MRNISKVLFLCFAFLFAASIFANSACASDWQMYVRSKPYENYKIVDSKFYVPVKAFLDALQYGYTQDGNGTLVVTRDKSVRSNFSVSGQNLDCDFAGKTFSLPIVKMGGSSYANLDIFASRFGLGMTKTAATRIIDIVDKESVFKHQENIARMTAYEKAMGSKGDKKEASSGSGNYDRENPVKQVGDVEGFLDQSTTWEARWSVKVKNEADEPVRNVMLILHVQDGTGKDMDQLVKSIGTLNPGQVSGADYYWQSLNRIIAFPKLEIKHDPLPKKETIESVEKKDRANVNESKSKDAPAEAEKTDKK